MEGKKRGLGSRHGQTVSLLAWLDHLHIKKRGEKLFHLSVYDHHSAMGLLNDEKIRECR